MNLQTLFFLGICLLVSMYAKAQNTAISTKNKVMIRDNQVDIHYLHQGQGELNLLFLPGWCINSTYWKEQKEHFSKKHSVYAIDLPGFGKSTAKRENWTIEEYAKDVNAFIEELELENVILIGHSMSGAIMLQAALDQPENMIGLIGIDNFKFIDVAFTAEQMEQMSAFFPMLEKDFAHAAPIYAENMLFHPSTSKEIKNRVKQDFAETNPIVGYSSFMNLMQFSALSSQKLDQLNHKLHLLNSDAIPTNTQGLADHLKKGYLLKEVSATGHYPMIEKAGAFNERLEEILEAFSQD